MIKLIKLSAIIGATAILLAVAPLSFADYHSHGESRQKEESKSRDEDSRHQDVKHERQERRADAFRAVTENRRPDVRANIERRRPEGFSGNIERRRPDGYSANIERRRPEGYSASIERRRPEGYSASIERRRPDMYRARVERARPDHSYRSWQERHRDRRPYRPIPRWDRVHHRVHFDRHYRVDRPWVFNYNNYRPRFIQRPYFYSSVYNFNVPYVNVYSRFYRPNERWVWVDGGEIPYNAIIYNERLGEPVFYCRSVYNNRMYYGLFSLNDGCYYDQGETFINFEEFEILVEG